MPPEAVVEQQEKPQAKSSSKKLLIILPVVVLLLAGGGAGVYWKFFHHAADEHAAEAAGVEKKVSEQVIQEMDTFMVNLADTGGKRFLKVTMKAKLDSAKLAEEFKGRVFEMRDLVLMILTSKAVDEVSTTEDKTALKKQIIAALNHSLQKGQVADLYFTEFLVQ